MKPVMLLLAVLPFSLAIPQASHPAPTVIDQLCGSRGLPPCPAGYECVARPGSTCGPETDCPGICVLSKPRPSKKPTKTKTKHTPSPSKIPCGTLRGLKCPPKLICISDPNSGGCGLACDEPGICVEPMFCGGFAGEPCPAGMECVDDWRDDCDPSNGGADCGGVCV